MLTQTQKRLSKMNLSRFPMLAAALKAAQQACPTCPNKVPDRVLLKAAASRLLNNQDFKQFVKANFGKPISIGGLVVGDK